MNIKHKHNVQAAIEEAKRFLARAEENLNMMEVVINDDPPFKYVRVDGKANAAMKRASMDLTRALAKVRSRT